MKKYAICGVSNRALGMFIKPMLTTFSEHKIVSLLDHDEARFEACKKRFPTLAMTPVYFPEEFQKMVEREKPDAVIVAGRDDTHVDYIMKALENNLDVITEKPMVTTAEDARKVMEAEKKSEGSVKVTFNYRYNPYHRKIKEMILDGRLGRITSVDLNWYIDTYHGASYFKRWNRYRDRSGGLSIHKSTHHFDLVNWWLNDVPEEVFAYGSLHYYGEEGEWNPLKESGRFCGTCHVKNRCHYYQRWNNRSESRTVQDDHLQQDMMNGNQAMYTNYRPDACIFDDDIEIEDTYAAAIKYKKGALLSYSINFSLPYEGYRLAINGTKGRIETTEYHEPSRIPFQFPKQKIDYFPLFGAKESIEVVETEGGHGGGDPLLLEELFLGRDPLRNYDILAGAEAGAYSIAVGEGVWRSVQEKRPISIESLLKFKEKSRK
ncbi:Gfo/Idh/MocA family protein [Priestia endophytica]|uniref:Oxidoreductase n=1 Tax=Priestia endophytica TaxID=135735 RepID=A0AAX1Q5L5_9BACI|nr:Gfo/Idh/MocA family oxidoreductase [Priestia endophytica]RAS72018.1 oxidoreductase [Priestia endophytica]RAS84953.1 oxidoreductase [Priestia endophytica]RAS89653.1 oxidoreductase [Priestia endophytica]